MQSSGSESASPMTLRVQSLSSTDTRGKHRIQVELKRLEQEARFLEIPETHSSALKAVLGAHIYSVVIKCDMPEGTKYFSRSPAICTTHLVHQSAIAEIDG